MSRVIRSLVDGRQARAYAGLTGYDGQLGGSRVAWTASVRADTRGFAAAAVPRVSEYRFGLALTWTVRRAAPGRGRAAAAAGRRRVVERGLRGRRPAAWRTSCGRAWASRSRRWCSWSLDDEVLRAIMRRAATAPLSVLAGPLAAAMPDWELSADRQSVYRRRELYSKLWAQYLADPQAAPERWAIEAEHQLARQFEATSLARLERQYQIARPYTFAGLIELNGGPATAEACRRFHQGLGTLGRAIEGAGPDDEVVARALTDLGQLFSSRTTCAPPASTCWTAPGPPAWSAAPSAR